MHLGTVVIDETIICPIVGLQLAHSDIIFHAQIPRVDVTEAQMETLNGDFDYMTFGYDGSLIYIGCVVGGVKWEGEVADMVDIRVALRISQNQRSDNWVTAHE